MDLKSVKEIQTIIESGIGKISGDKHSQELREFFTVLAVCHTCVIEKNGEY
jgi:hypothetical protein